VFFFVRVALILIADLQRAILKMDEYSQPAFLRDRAFPSFFQPRRKTNFSICVLRSRKPRYQQRGLLPQARARWCGSMWCGSIRCGLDWPMPSLRKECLGWSKYKPSQIIALQEQAKAFLQRYHYHRLEAQIVIAKKTLGLQQPKTSFQLGYLTPNEFAQKWRQEQITRN